MPDECKKVPLRRHCITLESKIHILDRLKNGEKISYVAKIYKLNESTIRTIKRNEQKIRTSVAAGSSVSTKMSVRPRPPIIERMEKGLSIWIEDNSNKRIPLDGSAIKQKALQIYNQLKESGEFLVKPEFVASKGWFERFKKRFSLHNKRIQRGSASVDTDAVKKFVRKFQQIVEERGYTPYQVFNAGELCLWWKRMPSRTFISKSEEAAAGFMASKVRFRLLMCSNASGDSVMKPMLVYKSSAPSAMRSGTKDELPVYCKASKKAWVSANLFKHWFLNCFVPAVEIYLKQKNLDTKVLLIMDDTPSHPKDLKHANVEIMFLPANIASLIQPLDQGIISTFKTYYIRNSLQWILEKTDSESIEMAQAWQHFSVMDCIGIIASSLQEVQPSQLNACWKNIWPGSVHSGNMIEPAENGIDTVIEIANFIGGEGFDDMTAEDVQELLVEKEISEAGLLEIESKLNEMNSNDDSIEENFQDPGFTLNSVQEGINLANQLESYFLNADPSSERSTKFKRDLQNCLAPYHEIYNDLLNKSKQIQIADAIKKVEDTQYFDVDAESSEDEDILELRKHPCMIMLSSDDEEEDDALYENLLKEKIKI